MFWTPFDTRVHVIPDIKPHLNGKQYIYYITESGIASSYTVQLKGNLIPACVLQIDNSWVKITLCIQYMNGHQSRSCSYQANCWAFTPTNVALILNKLFNEA